MKTNGKIIPVMDGEEFLFWRRVKRLQKMIRISKWRKRFTDLHMWNQKLIELSKNIDKKRICHSTTEWKKLNN
jgi:hypothetical protein